MKSDRIPIRFSNAGIALCVASVLLGLWLMDLTGKRGLLIGCILIGLYALYSIRIADQWERVAVLRFGKYMGLRGPGLFHVIPLVDSVSRHIDQRVRVANVSAERAPVV